LPALAAVAGVNTHEKWMPSPGCVTPTQFLFVINPKHQVSAKIPVSLIDFSVDTPPEVPDIITVKNGEAAVIPLIIETPKEESMNLKVGVGAQGEEPIFVANGIGKLPAGISAVLDKHTINLPVEAG